MPTNSIQRLIAVGLVVAGGLAAAYGAVSAPATGHHLATEAAQASGKIAFITMRPGGRGIPRSAKLSVVNADGSGLRTLAPNAFPDTPVWSPSGRRIAFVRDHGSINLVNVEIYVMNADGSGQRRLTRNPARDAEAAWSPDGRQIAFIREPRARRRLPGGLVPGPVTDKVGVYVMNADGSGQRRLTSNSVRVASPSWSPDGRQIAFRQRGGGRGVYVMNADGSGLRSLAPNAYAPAWSPDGRQITFEHREPTSNPARPPGADIYVMNADGSGQRNLTRNAASDGDAAWSPDGRRIVFTRKRGPELRPPDVYVMNADGSGQRMLIPTGAEPRWSPGGRRIAFLRNFNFDHFSRNRGFRDVYIMSADGSGLRRLTGNPRGTYVASLAWSPRPKR